MHDRYLTAVRFSPAALAVLGWMSMAVVCSHAAEQEKKSDPAVSEPAPAAAPAKVIESKTMYYRLLARKPAATLEDAVRAVARFRGGAEELRPLAVEIEDLEKKGIKFPKDIIRRKDETLTIGAAAHMLMKAMGIKGGLMYKIFPNNQRYALREATNLGIVQPNSFMNQTMSGNDLVGMLVRVNEVRDQQQKEKESPKEDSPDPKKK